jgi:hypothetical protein
MMKVIASKSLIPRHPVKSVVHDRRLTMFVMCVVVPFKVLPPTNAPNRGYFGNT